MYMYMKIDCINLWFNRQIEYIKTSIGTTTSDSSFYRTIASINRFRRKRDSIDS